MGMFDDIQCDAMQCPLCGMPIPWQSKDGDCVMDIITVHQLFDTSARPRFYGTCHDCKIWVDVEISRPFGRTEAQWKQFHRERALIEQRRQQAGEAL